MYYITQSLQINDNLFDLSAVTLGWVDHRSSRNDFGFLTGDYIAVSAGDVITFGAAVTTQGWHLVTYDRHRQPMETVTVNNGITVFGQLNQELSIMQYVVPYGVAFIRPVVDNRFSHCFVLTRNKEFTAEQYRSWMTDAQGGLSFNGQQVNRDGVTLLLNLEGAGRVIVEGESIPFEAGTVLCIPPHTLFYKVSDTGFRDLRLVCHKFGTNGTQVTLLKDDPSQSIEALMRLMLRMFWDPLAGDERILQQLFTTVEQIVQYRLEEQQPRRSQVKRMLAALQTDFTDPDFTLERVFCNEGYCPNHLRRLFKEETDCTPLEYLIRLRLHHAKRLMAQNKELHASVAQIALMSGFRDPCYFSRIFKKKEGISPAQYMKSKI